MGMNVNFVARQLVGASPGMFGFRGGKAIVRFRPGVLIRASFRAGGQLLFIVLEIVINPLQLAAQAVFLAGAHPGDFARHFVFQGPLQQFPPARRMDCRPVNSSGGLGRFLVEADLPRQGIVGCSAGQ